MPLKIAAMIRQRRRAVQEKKIKLNEGRLAELKAEADLAKRQKVQLEEEAKYMADLQAVKDLKKQRREARLAPIKSFAGNVRKRIRENAGTKGLDTGPRADIFSPSKNPFYDNEK